MPGTARPLLGCHMPTSGGLDKGIASGLAIGCNVVQIFTKSPQQWAAKPLDDALIDRFHAAAPQLAAPVVAHDSYLINLCAEDPEKLKKSRDAFLDELERCEALGIRYLVTHMGATGEQTEDCSIGVFAESLNLIQEQTDGFNVQVALETTAGQGKSLGYRFDHFPKIFNLVEKPERLVVCFDTCHVFAAGYDLRGQEGYRAVMQEFDDVVGLDRIRVFHVNDSKKELGSRVDRHNHIGEGFIGPETFRVLLTDDRFHDRPKILETPESETMHPVNLRRLWEFAGIQG
ncbi:MAG: deoxyribonuclease IV [Armatimonadetes bacterium]|nr:deoxyribonuclease IV [Armatimonadota bacterium]